MPMDYHVWTAMLECCQEIHAKADQHCRLPSRKTVLLTMWNDLLQEFIVMRAIASLHNRL